VTTEGKLIGKATLEHIIPKNKGGVDDLDNLSLACNSCNNMKGRTVDKLSVNHPKFVKMVDMLLERKSKRCSIKS